ncbi:MAG: peptidoglycan-associated lipoprotein Pal [Gemmatimonadota bacterium]
MRSGGWSAIALVATATVIVSTASCSKQVVRSQETQQTRQAHETRPASTIQAAVQTPDRSWENAGQAGRSREDRPRAEAAAPEAAEWVFVNEHIRFGFDSSLLSEEARQILRGKAEYLRTNPDVTATVEGHCDDRGTNAYNMALGGRRAESVKGYLVALGIGAGRLSTVSYGEERPVASGHDEASWARNRRAQLMIN